MSEEDRGITNNKAELRALLEAVRAAEAKARAWKFADSLGVSGLKPHIEVYTDSTYALLRAAAGARKRANGTSSRKHGGTIRQLRRTLERVKDVLGPSRVRILKVRGHSGHAGNDVADRLAAEGRDGRAMPSANLHLQGRALKWD